MNIFLVRLSNLEIKASVQEISEHKSNFSRENLQDLADEQAVFRQTDFVLVLPDSVDNCCRCLVRTDRSEESWNAQSDVILKVLADDEWINMNQSSFDDLAEFSNAQFFHDRFVQALDCELRDTESELLSEAADGSNRCQKNDMSFAV